MKKYLIILFLLITNFLIGQNLVPNPSFENYTSCPTGDSQISKAFPWISPTAGTTDLLNTCASVFSSVNIPINYLGYQLPRTGNSYAGIFSYWNTAANLREYLQAPLISPMVAGQNYEISFYVSLSDESQYASNNLGAYFSNSAISRNDNQNFSCCSPQVVNTTIITDTSGWTQISGCYLANGGEQYITIGNFTSFSNSSFPMVYPPGAFFASYYFIDDVSVIPIQTNNSIPADTTLCQGDSLILNSSAYNANYLWQDSSIDSVLTVTQQGVYWVEVTNVCGTVSDTINISYDSQLPSLNLGNDTSLCQGEILTLNASHFNVSYLWQDNSTDSVYSVNQQGIYWVQITNTCGDINDSISVIYNSYPTVNLGNDTTLCEGDSLILNVSILNGDYLWQDNSIDSVFTVTQQGVYWSEVMLNNCNTIDTINVDYILLPSINLGNDTILCYEELLIIDAYTINANYLWQDSSINHTFNVTDQGEYWVKVSNSCGNINDTINIYLKDCNVSLLLPNVFTPNGDNRNDFFMPLEIQNVEQLQTLIYNRWGELIFQSEFISIGWDGKTNAGINVPSGTYFWVINYLDKNKKEASLKGFISLLRD